MHVRFIRHGESVANQEGRLQGQMDFPLSEQGKWQAKALGEWLAWERIDYLYSSDLSRAFHTAREVAVYHQLPVHLREDLREMNLGCFQGLTRKEIKERYPKYASVDLLTSGLKGVEQAQQLQERGLAVIDELLSKHYGERVVVVTHGGLISNTLMALLEIPWQKKRVFTFENTSMTTLDFHSPQQFMILGVNERPHLQLKEPRTRERKGVS